MSWRPEVTKLQRENSRSYTAHALSTHVSSVSFVSLVPCFPTCKVQVTTDSLQRTTHPKWVNSGKALRGSDFQVTTHSAAQ